MHTELRRRDRRDGKNSARKGASLLKETAMEKESMGRKNLQTFSFTSLELINRSAFRVHERSLKTLGDKLGMHVE